MPNGFGQRGGWGFGFRGSSPPWPFIGVGRGGLPRCGYFLTQAGMPPQYWGPPGVGAMPPYEGYPFGATSPGASPYASSLTPEQELDYLRNQAEAMREQLEEIEARIRDLEAKGE